MLRASGLWIAAALGAQALEEPKRAAELCACMVKVSHAAVGAVRGGGEVDGFAEGPALDGCRRRRLGVGGRSRPRLAGLLAKPEAGPAAAGVPGWADRRLRAR